MRTGFRYRADPDHVPYTTLRAADERKKRLMIVRENKVEGKAPETSREPKGDKDDAEDREGQRQGSRGERMGKENGQKTPCSGFCIDLRLDVFEGITTGSGGRAWAYLTVQRARETQAPGFIRPPQKT
ncbi:unnamed protein product [Pleuronectes platessa]|uniref:Uncharacterized protein n=1 Tax=Pleuronectes platessa TaxID=8262 RepID=A0A9N7YAB2_PLEPL|nr:unnamed protein product [Pleuronectes platessa]